MKLTAALITVFAIGTAFGADTPVVVNNSTKAPVPVVAQSTDTFTFSKEIINPGGSGQVEYFLFSVPAGKKLVIETISVRTRSVGLFDLRLRFNAPQQNSFPIPLSMWPVQNPLPSEGVILSGMHNVRLYVPANQSVRLQMVGGMAVPAPNNQTFVDVAISGHFVDEF